MSYSPNLGRWLQEDPTEFAAGDLNFYRFVGNEPMGSTDPTGKMKKDPAEGAKGHIGAMVDGLKFTDAEKKKIKDILNRLIDKAQFGWQNFTGPFGSCQEWVDAYYEEASKTVKDLMDLKASGINIVIGKKEWQTWWLGGHAAVQITVSDGGEPLTFYLDDGHIGGDDHVFIDNEIPSNYSHYTFWRWDPNDSPQRNGVEPAKRAKPCPDNYFELLGWTSP